MQNFKTDDSYMRNQSMFGQTTSTIARRVQW